MVRVRFDTSLGNHEFEEFSRSYTKSTLGCVELEAVLSQSIEHSLEISEMIFCKDTLNHHIINVDLYCFPKLPCEYLCDHSLVHSPSVFQSKRHYFVTKDPPWCNEGYFFLIRRVHCYLVVPLECVQKTHSLVTRCNVKKLVNFGQREWILRAGFVQVSEVYTNVVYSVSAPVSVWPLERNISISVRFGFTANIYIYIVTQIST